MNTYQITFCRVVPGPRSVEFVQAFSVQGAVNRFRGQFPFVEECGGKILQVSSGGSVFFTAHEDKRIQVLI